MTGLPGWFYEPYEGWFEESAGIAPVYLSLDMEGFLSAAGDTPPHTPFLARIKNGMDFCIDRQHKTYLEEDNGTAASYAAYSRLEVDNSRGEFTYLIGSDCRDAIVVIQSPIANAVGTLTGAPVVCTAVLDSIEAPDPSTIVFVLKDILATYDRPMRVRRLPGFVDEGAVGKMVVMTFGAVRMMEPLLMDSPLRQYILSDAVVANVTAVRDKGALLDPHAAIPQYTPALNGSGLQLAVLPEGGLRVDCSSEGSQSVIPGADNVLPEGDFNPWVTPTAAPTGWAWTGFASSNINRKSIAQNYPADYCAQILSSRPWGPTVNRYGDVLSSTATPLKGGRAYRVSFKVHSTTSSYPFFAGGLRGGIMVRSAISFDEADAISPHGLALEVPLYGRYAYTFLHRCPPGADRAIYIHAVAADGSTPATGNGQGGGIIYDVQVQEIGQYTDLPMLGISLNNYFDEILYTRVGTGISWSQADCNSLDLATLTSVGFPLGVYFREPPNVTDALRIVCASYCAQIFTDATGLIRIKRLVAPEDAVIVAKFDKNCVQRKTISKEPFLAPGLTMTIGVAKNWDPYTDGDYITDTDLLTPDQRVRYSQSHQYFRKSSVNPALRYQHANNAPPLQSLFDNEEAGQKEINRVNAIFSSRVYGNGLTTGERNLVTFEATFDDFVLGVGPSIAPQNLLWGAGITLDMPLDGFNNTPMIVLGYKFYPWARKMIITAMY